MLGSLPCCRTIQIFFFMRSFAVNSMKTTKHEQTQSLELKNILRKCTLRPVCVTSRDVNSFLLLILSLSLSFWNCMITRNRIRTTLRLWSRSYYRVTSDSHYLQPGGILPFRQDSAASCGGQEVQHRTWSFNGHLSSFSSAIRLWNSVPPEAQTAVSLDAFKRKLRSWTESVS